MLKKVDSFYKKMAGFLSIGTAITYGFYEATQSIVEKYVPGGVWNSEAWNLSGPNWGFDSFLAGTTTPLAGIFAAVTFLGTTYSIGEHIK